MPRQPTGRPPGRPRGSGQLENPTRLTVWLNSETYARLEAYADGRHYHRGDPQISACVRELLEHALACPYKNQTQNIPVLHGDNNKPIENVLAGAQNNSEQIETITATPENNYYEQIETVPTQATHKTRPVTDTVTDTHAQAETVGTAPGAGHVTDTVTDTVPVSPATRKAPALSAVTDTVSDTVTVTSPALEPFDTTKYRLGKLCPRGHDYQGSGQSLRVNKKAGYCIACNVAQQRTSRARQRQATAL